MEIYYIYVRFLSVVFNFHFLSFLIFNVILQSFVCIDDNIEYHNKVVVVFFQYNILKYYCFRKY